MSKNNVLTLIGLALILMAAYLIFWNEGVGLRGVKPEQYMGYQVLSVPNSPVDFNNNKQMVYTTGMLTTTDVLQDPMLGISDKVIQLIRKVEMLQWVQTEDTKKQKLSDGSEQQVVTYNYRQTWSSDLIDSNAFKDAAAHQNPVNFPLNGLKGKAQNIMVGDFHIAPSLVDNMKDTEPMDLSSVDLTNLQRGTKLAVQHQGQYIFIGANMDKPAIGDVRISVLKIAPQMVSVIAEQVDGALSPANINGKPAGLVMVGQVPMKEMIHRDATTKPWQPLAIRLAALVLMLMAANLLLYSEGIYTTFGSLLCSNYFILTLVIGITLWAIPAAIVWFIIKPLWAATLFVLVVALYFLLYSLKKRGRLG